MKGARPHRVVIVGGGISGLATAEGILRELQEKPVELRVLEAEQRPGGKIWTERAQGVCHETGPNGWLDAKPSTTALAHRLGLSSQLIQADEAAAHRFILQRGHLVELPASPGAFLRSPILSTRAKLRMAVEWALPRRDPAAGDESLADFGRRRLGEEAVTWLLDPFVTGIHAGDPERISVQAAFPRIAALERDHGGLVRGLIAKRRETARRGRAEQTAKAGPAGPGGTLTSLRGGLRTLVEALAERLGDRLLLDHEATGIECAAQGFTVHCGERAWPADQVVLALPALATATLLAPFSAAAAEACRAIPYAPVAVVETLFDRRDLAREVKGFGFLCPGVERREILGTLWTSAIFPGQHAPQGSVLLRTLVGGRRQPDLAKQSEDALVQMVLSELSAIMGVSGMPQRTLVTRWREAIPQYELGHLERVASVDAALPAGLHVLGSAFRGIGINECTAAAVQSAAAVARRYCEVS